MFQPLKNKIKNFIILFWKKPVLFLALFLVLDFFSIAIVCWKSFFKKQVKELISPVRILTPNKKLIKKIEETERMRKLLFEEALKKEYKNPF